MKILLAGATGFIGRQLISDLIKENHELFLLTRQPSKVSLQPHLKVLRWDGFSVGEWGLEAEGVHAVINLCGEGIADKRWSQKRKDDLLQSRILSTRAIVEFIQSATRKPGVLLNASAIGYYGNVPQGNVTETHSKGEGFLPDVCDLWEREAKRAESFGVRTVLLRTGIVLEKDGGALAKMLFPFKMFAGGPLGSGHQAVAWIHRDDEVGAIMFALKNPTISGPINLTAPNPVTMKEFCSTLGKVMHRPSWAPVPAFALKILLGEMSEMLLQGQRAVPQKLLGAGYNFQFPQLESAFKHILKS